MDREIPVSFLRGMKAFEGLNVVRAVLLILTDSVSRSSSRLFSSSIENFQNVKEPRLCSLGRGEATLCRILRACGTGGDCGSIVKDSSANKASL